MTQCPGAEPEPKTEPLTFQRAVELALKNSAALASSEAGIVPFVSATQRRLDTIFQKQLAPVAGTRNFDRGVIPFEAEVKRLEGRIDAFNLSSARQAQAATAHADSTASSARRRSPVHCGRCRTATATS